MAIDSRYKMSQERLDTLKEELHYLETTREKEVAADQGCYHPRNPCC